ncbi:stage II sporulation protein P [Brevibacillus fluminis]|uniref:stage II sporulation protein P n=1 Tax=Brevibacillus fluminis TaxID=511487 RepID=UPI003F8CA52A
MAAILQRHFVVLSLCTAFLFVLTGILSLSGNRVMPTSNTLQQAAANISSLAMLKVIGREIPSLADSVETTAAQSSSWTSFLFEAMTNIQPGDLRSLLGRELPGLLTFDDARIIVPGLGTELSDLYVENTPHDLPNNEVPQTPGGGQTGQKETTPPATTVPPKTSTGEPKPNTPIATKGNVVFIYHSHNRESWLSETKRVGQSVDSPTRNITLVGERLADNLREKGIGVDTNTDDITQRLVDQGRSFTLSYAESLKVVKSELEENRNIRYLFDLHRDDQPREKTTIEINGKSYARLFFVIGLMNKNHEKNAEFATKLHMLLEKKYPGLSRGVTGKGSKDGNGEYNQSISPGSLLIEFGGTGNTVQECYNSAAALADVFAEYYWQAERANATVTESTDKR